ncbi:hypothetical protein [Methanoculleus sp.]|uniref:hypothetical protein n=1 Tax=Methanoculleus sp. TaxID=90427 RepID=UPI00262E42C7|nr:hypothetical protein [Methanoculleus sp.]
MRITAPPKKLEMMSWGRERHRQAGDPGTGDERRDVHVEHPEDHEDGDEPDHVACRDLEHPDDPVVDVGLGLRRHPPAVEVDEAVDERGGRPRHDQGCHRSEVLPGEEPRILAEEGLRIDEKRYGKPDGAHDDGDGERLVERVKDDIVEFRLG